MSGLDQSRIYLFVKNKSSHTLQLTLSQYNLSGPHEGIEQDLSKVQEVDLPAETRTL
jgi:hypothetical protein